MMSPFLFRLYLVSTCFTALSLIADRFSFFARDFTVSMSVFTYPQRRIFGLVFNKNNVYAIKHTNILQNIGMFLLGKIWYNRKYG